MQEKNFFQRNMGWIITVAVVLLVIFWGVSKYNSFVRQNVQIDTQWAQVENQYQRRFDLIPNIVNTVKGAAKQDLDAIRLVTEARTKYSGATTIDEKAQAASQVEGALGRLLVIAENYPALQSQQSYRDLMVTLEGTENRISVERMKFNDEVKALNSGVKVFPSSVVASIFGIKERAYFEVPKDNQANPTVNFSN